MRIRHNRIPGTRIKHFFYFNNTGYSYDIESLKQFIKLHEKIIFIPLSVLFFMDIKIKHIWLYQNPEPRKIERLLQMKIAIRNWRKIAIVFRRRLSGKEEKFKVRLLSWMRNHLVPFESRLFRHRNSNLILICIGVTRGTLNHCTTLLVQLCELEPWI